MKYEVYMKKCIELAKSAQGNTSPNPLVGCVVLNKDGIEIANGFHRKYGENHAERDALLKIKNGEDKNGTLIVNLEPCSHFGKTPPCVDLIIDRKIKKVVIGMRDVNPIVSGNGIKKLNDAGIEVVENVLNDECCKLNEIFIKNMRKKKTFIAIKTATTLDGKTATANGSSKWITSENARKEVKNIRKKYDAILTTSSTIIADNPTMEHKIKIIIDRELKTDFDAKIYQSGEIIVFYGKNSLMNSEQILMNCKQRQKKSSNKTMKFFETPMINNKLDLNFIFNKLFELKIMSVLIECGGELNGNALEFTDKIYHFIAPKITGDNSAKSCFDYRKISDINKSENFKIAQVEIFEPDILLTYYPIQKFQ